MATGMDDCSHVPVCTESVCVQIAIGMDDCCLVPVCAESVCVRVAIRIDDCSLMPVCVQRAGTGSEEAGKGLLRGQDARRRGPVSSLHLVSSICQLIVFL